MRSSIWKIVVFSLLLVCNAGRASAQLGGVTLQGRIPVKLQGCVSSDSLKIGYLHAMAAIGMNDTRGVNLAVTIQTLGSTDPEIMVLELSASSWGRSLGTRQLRVRASDCAALPRGFGDVIARMHYEATALDAGRRPTLLAPAPLPFQAEDVTPENTAELSEHVALGVGAGIAFGLLPSAALGLQLQAATPNYPISLRFKLGMLWPQRYEVGTGAIEADSYDLTLEMCPSYRLPSWDRLTLRICAGPRVGFERARGRDLADPTETRARAILYFGLTPEISLRLAGATWLQLGGGLALGIIRPHLLIGVDRERRSIELPDASIFRRDIIASIVQIL